MKNYVTSFALIGVLALQPANLHSQETKVETRIGDLRFTHDFANGYPTDATVEKLFDELDFQRACQAYIWALPAVSGKAWFPYFRLYSPKKAFLDRTWVLPDIERAN